MSRKTAHQMHLIDDAFKMIKKNKKSIELRVNDEKRQNINVGDTIVFINNKNNKIMRKKVKNLYKYSNFEELYKNIEKTKFGYKKNEDANYQDMERYYSNDEIEKYGVVAIELKRKRHILIKIIAFILILFSVIFVTYLINNKLSEIRDKKINKAINDLAKDRTEYIFIEINPSFVITIKDNKVNNLACLNDDCVSIYDQIYIEDKTIAESIDYLYNLTRSKGFDTSNGVKVKTTTELNIIDKDYIEVELISETTKNELLSNIKNNEEIKNINNDDYYVKLWEELKKDKDYGKLYSCNMNNKELECYITLDTGINKDSDYNFNSENDYNKFIMLFNNSANKVYNTLKKFNFDVRNNKVYINNIEFSYIPLFTLNDTPYKNVLDAEIIEPLNDDICTKNLVEYSDGKCQINDGIYLIPLNKLNLVKPSTILDNLIISRFGLKEKILQQYELNKMLEEDKQNQNTKDEILKQQEEEQKRQKQAENERIINYRNQLISEGYILNREETNKRCSSNQAGLCEYLCLYKKDENGFNDISLGTIACEFIVVQD